MIAERCRNKNTHRVRAEQALERKEYRAGLSPAQQIDILDARLGKNVGAKRERTRLLDKQLAGQMMAKAK